MNPLTSMCFMSAPPPLKKKGEDPSGDHISPFPVKSRNGSILVRISRKMILCTFGAIWRRLALRSTDDDMMMMTISRGKYYSYFPHQEELKRNQDFTSIINSFLDWFPHQLRSRWALPFKLHDWRFHTTAHVLVFPLEMILQSY